MKIMKPAVAGTLESSDCMITVEPAEEGEGIILEIDSVVLKQYGESIKKVANQVIEEMKITDAIITIQDKGAFDCVIAARMEVAIERASKGGAVA